MSTLDLNEAERQEAATACREHAEQCRKWATLGLVPAAHRAEAVEYDHLADKFSCVA